MSFKIKLTKKNHLLLKSIFQNAPKSYEEAIIMGLNPCLPLGKKYKDLKNEERIIGLLFEEHINSKCICNNQLICLFKKYENNEISIDEIVASMK